jgi:hypothetical protein
MLVSIREINFGIATEQFKETSHSDQYFGNNNISIWQQEKRL